MLQTTPLLPAAFQWRTVTSRAPAMVAYITKMLWLICTVAQKIYITHRHHCPETNWHGSTAYCNCNICCRKDEIPCSHIQSYNSPGSQCTSNSGLMYILSSYYWWPWLCCLDPKLWISTINLSVFLARSHHLRCSKTFFVINWWIPMLIFHEVTQSEILFN